MAKKVIFLLSMMLVMLAASVTAFADTGTESTTPETGFTDDKSDIREDFSVSELEDIYGDVFFDEKSVSNRNVFKVTNERYVNKELRFNFTINAKNSSTDLSNPLVMLLYIKNEGEYVHLDDIKSDENITEGLNFANSVVDLKHLGVDKVNEVRVVAFRKKDATQLKLDENLQITNFDISVKAWTFMEKVSISMNDILKSLTKN